MIQMKRKTVPTGPGSAKKLSDSQRRRRSSPDRMRVGSRRPARPFAVPDPMREPNVEDCLPRGFRAGQIDLLDVDFDDLDFDDHSLLLGKGSHFPGRHSGSDPDGGDLW